MENDFRHIVARAVAHHNAGRLSEAESDYRAALAAFPGHAIVTHNLGVVAAAQGRHEAARDCFDAAIAADPHYASAHYNRGVALIALGQAREAASSLGRACQLEPAYYDAHRALGFLWLAAGDRGRALDHFARTYELRRGEDRTGIAANSLTGTTRDKLLHDAAQFRFLSRGRRGASRFAALAGAYEDVARDSSEEPAALSEAQLDILGEDYNTAINLCAAPELASGAVNVRSDVDALTRQFQEHSAGAVYFDGLLTPQALLTLQRYLNESTIWHDYGHIGGFVASYLEDGLACPLLLQIADEIRRLFPAVLGDHPLTQAWAFKGLHTSATVEAHADDAAVSVNFWVTPDAANLVPGSGGLEVCRVPPPADWAMTNYDADQGTIVAFLEQNADKALIVPYRENRAVLFESRLFHRSDTPRFASEYENHRINLTFLYGHHEP